MQRDVALDLLRSHLPELRARFGVAQLSLFGSLARNDSTSSSDVDLLVVFDGPGNSAQFFGLQFFLEDVLGCKVDLVTNKALRQELRSRVEAELVNV